MSLRPLHHVLAIALFVAAPVAAQTSAPTSASPDTTATTSGGHNASMSHGAAKHTAAPRTRARSDTASHPTGGTGNAQYETALRRCVQMSGDERERCLDEAIARYGS